MLGWCRFGGGFRALLQTHREQMELPFYLMSPDSPGTSWDGLVSLQGDDLHFELKGGGEEEPTEFDVPLETVTGAEFQRGLVSRRLCLKVENDELRRRFPAGVTGEEVHLMVARYDPDFATGPNTELEFERLAGQIERRGAVEPAARGLAS